MAKIAHDARILKNNCAKYQRIGPMPREERKDNERTRGKTTDSVDGMGGTN